MNSCKFGLKLLGVVIFLSATLAAQTSTGTFSGLVTDESGAVVPGAQVAVTNIETGIARNVQTDSGGRYRVPSLVPGRYEIEAQVAGFETAVRSGIQLAVGQEAVINVTLKIGQVSQKTVVTGEAPMIETTTSTLSGLVDDKTIRDLPLNGRSFDQLISLEASAPTFHQTTTIAQSVFTVNGARTQSNLFLMDGTEMASAAFQMLLPGGALGINMGVDAIQEFNVLTGSYSAEYGKKAGGMVTIATRSGTNQLHGSVFEFLRNSDLDARNFFDRGSAPPAFKRNQFGGTVGGPIKKDRTFFFGNYEGLRQNLGETLIATVPNNASRLLAVPAVQPFLTLFPAPNGRDFGDGSAQSINSAAKVGSEDFFLIRVDRKLSDKDFFFGRYNFTRALLTTPDIIPITANTNRSRDQLLTLDEKRVYATAVNELRFGYTRAYMFLNDLPVVPTPASLVFFPGAETVGNISFGGVGSIQGALSTAGTGLNADRALAINFFTGSDQLYLNRGAHSLQVGVEVQRVQRNEAYTNYARGSQQFAGLAGFLAGTPTIFRAPLLSGSIVNDPHKGFRQVYFATFVQDDYKVRPNLTLNLGLRYEFMTAPTDVNNRLSNYYFQNDANGNPILVNTPRLGAPLFESHWKSFAPRVGFAWDPFGDGKMSVRGGAGIFYDQSLDAEFQFFTQNNAPYYSVVQVNNPPFPFGFSASGNAIKAAPDTINFNIGVPTLKSWNFGVQREITSNMVFNISYVGSSSYHLTRRTDGNTAIPVILPDGSKFFPANSAPRNPTLGGSREIATDANASYNALQLSVTQRLSHNLRFKGSYSHSKNLDNGSNPNGPQINGTPDTPMDPFNVAVEKGLSAFDLRNSVALNFTYDLPGQGLKAMAGKLVGGWQLSGIGTIQSGTPFTVQTGFSQSRNQANENVDRPSLAPGANSNPVLGGPNRYYNSSVFVLPPAGTYGNVARNTLIAPGFGTFDVTLSKGFPIKERLRADFRAEFFNVLNRANFGLPDIIVFNPNGSYRGAAGTVSATASSSRQIQFGLKLSF
jgi:outer membrane receptor protein involved in Fe transport